MSTDHDAAAAPDHDVAAAPDHDVAAAPDHDNHGHAERPLGPIDVAAWGAGLLGLMIGIAIAACFVLATSPPA